jgi:hypothetical protein
MKKKEECYLMPQLPVTKTRFLEQKEQDKGKTTKKDDYRHGQIDLEGWNNQRGSRRMMGREKKIRIKSDEGIYATCSLQVLHARKQNHAMERKLENSLTRNGRKWCEQDKTWSL